VADPELEPDPIEGKLPYIDVDVRAAYDSEYLYMRFEWASERPGITHDLWRYDGAEWVKWGGPKPDALEKGVTPSYEDRLALNISDRNLPAGDGSNARFAQQGCWITCHSSMRAMSREPSKDEVKAHPYLGDTGLGKSDVRKYLLLSREQADEAGGWDKVRAQEEIQRLLDEGDFLDMWMWRGARSGPAGYGDDFYVLEYRLSDGGTGPFMTPAEPEYMYDASKVGFYAIPEDKLEEMLADMGQKLNGVLYLAVPDDELVRRLSGRWICSQCQTPYHTIFSPPAVEGMCDACGGTLYQRDDDKPETVRARLKVYHRQTAPLIDYYCQAGLLIEVDGARDIETVNAALLEAIRKLR
jgi:hypothetical protein